MTTETFIFAAALFGIMFILFYGIAQDFGGGE